MADKQASSGRNMSKQSALKQIVHLLADFNEPVDFNTLDKALGNLYKERTLRRWLSELVDKGTIKKTGIKKGTLYQSVSPEKPSSSPPGVEAAKDGFSRFLGAAALRALASVRQPIYTRQPVTYNDDWIDSYQPNKTYYLSPEARETLTSLGVHNLASERAGTYARKIYNRLLIDLSYNSSRLEGNTYSLVDTEKLIIDGVGQNEKLDEERVMIINHKEAIRYLVENAEPIEIIPAEIYTLHYLLSSNSR